MSGLNKAMLIGNLGRDPELKYTQNGNSVCNFSIATSESWKDKDGNSKESTEWHRIVVWGKQAENCAKYLVKGRTVYVEGNLRTRQWEDKDGNKRNTTEINAQVVQFLGGQGKEQATGSGDTQVPEQPALKDGVPASDDDGFGF